MFSQSRQGVLVVGSVSADVTTFASRAPRPGETILGEMFTLMLGGKGANQAIAASRALPADSTAAAYFVGCVGDDLFAPMVVSGLHDAGVNTDFLRQVPGQTGIAHIRVTVSGENDIVVVPNANAALTAADISQALAQLGSRCAVLLTQLEIPAKLALHTAQQAAAAGVRMVLDPAPATQLPDELWQFVDTVTPNETEAEQLTGIAVVDRPSAVAAGEWFVQRGVRHALVTLASAGSVLVTAQGHEFFEPFRVEAVDTTAAGDAFAGHLAAALAQGAELREAIRLANAAGALAVTKRGASASLPTGAAVQEFLTQHG